jgi:hypothetical protein
MKLNIKKVKKKLILMNQTIKSLINYYQQTQTSTITLSLIIYNII